MDRDTWIAEAQEVFLQLANTRTSDEQAEVMIRALQSAYHAGIHAEKED